MASIASKPLLAQVQELLTQVTSKVTSSDDCLDVIETEKVFKGSHFARHEQAYKIYGQSFIRELQQTAKLSRIGLAAFQALNAISKETQTFFENYILILNLVRPRFLVGECGELSDTVALQASSFCHSLTVTFGQKKNNAPFETNRWHKFVILSTQPIPHKNILPDIVPDDLFAQIPDGVIVDPLLKVACLVSQVKDTRLDQYIKTYQLRYLLKRETIGSPHFSLGADVSVIVKRTDSIYERTKKLLPLTPYKDNHPWYAFLQKTLDQHNAPQALAALQELFPKAEWKKEVKHEALNIWIQGSKEETQPVADKLKQLGVPRQYSKAQDKETWYVVLTNPDPLQLRLTARLSDVFLEDTGKLTKLIAHYVERPEKRASH